MRFTDACAMPLCSPTRTSILSGQYTSRHGVTPAVGRRSPAKAFLPSQADPSVPVLLPESGTYLAPPNRCFREIEEGEPRDTNPHLNDSDTGRNPLAGSN